MQVRQATSHASTPAAVARELHEALAGSDLALVLFFCAPEYATAGFAAEIARLPECDPAQGGTPNHPYKQGDNNALMRFSNAVTAWAKAEK